MRTERATKTSRTAQDRSRIRKQNRLAVTMIPSVAIMTFLTDLFSQTVVTRSMQKITSGMQVISTTQSTTFSRS